MQLLDALDPRLAGAQLREVGVTGGTKLIVALAETLFKVAVTVALWVLPIVPVVALNVPEVAPAPTVREAGTVSAVPVLVRLTRDPPAGAD